MVWVYYWVLFDLFPLGNAKCPVKIKSRCITCPPALHFITVMVLYTCSWCTNSFLESTTNTHPAVMGAVYFHWFSCLVQQSQFPHWLLVWLSWMVVRANRLFGFGAYKRLLLLTVRMGIFIDRRGTIYSQVWKRWHWKCFFFFNLLLLCSFWFFLWKFPLNWHLTQRYSWLDIITKSMQRYITFKI